MKQQNDLAPALTQQQVHEALKRGARDAKELQIMLERSHRRSIMRSMGLLLFLLGCPQPQPPPQPDASDASSLGDAFAPCASACVNLAKIGCLEGADLKCAPACMTGLVSVSEAACWASAADKTTARACGGLSCP